MGAPELAMIRGRNLAVLRFDEEHGIFSCTTDGMCLDPGRSLEGAAMEWRDSIDSKRVAGRKRPTGGSAGLMYPPPAGPAVAVVTLDGADGGAW
jgi:hypothetical protein